MRFGLIYELCRPEPFDGFASEEEIFWQAVEQAAVAEEVGFDCVWAVEHHFLEGYSICSAPEVFLTTVAQRTERIRIGHGVRLLPARFNHPVRSAEMAAMLDIASRGRLEMGVGRSITDAELGGFGIATEDSRPMFLEVLPELVRMWTTDEYPGFDGTYFSMPPRKVLPKPIQQPHPPLWMACTQPASFELAAELGIGVLCFGVGAPGDVLESSKRYREIVKRAPRQVGQFVNDRIAPATVMFCSEDPTRAMQMGAAAALWFQASAERLFAPWQGKDVEGYEYYANVARELSAEQMALALQYGCVGTPDLVEKGCRAYQEAGVDQLVFLVQVGRIPHADILASLRLFGRDVLPQFR